MESPQKRPNEKRPRECLQTACTAVSSSIAVNQNAIESVQPDVERTIFSDFETTSSEQRFPILRQVCDVVLILRHVNDFFPILGQVSEFFVV